jgi:hypothetical protein
VLLGGLGQLKKYPMTPSGIEPATFRLVTSENLDRHSKYGGVDVREVPTFQVGSEKSSI